MMQLQSGLEPYPGYRLTQFLGKGGWGEVWKASRADGEVFALKFLAGDSQLSSAQEIRALQAMRQLTHPHLVRIEHIWSCSDYLVIVMEVAEGSLLDLLDVYYTEFNTPITAEHLGYFLLQAAQAIDFLNVRQHQLNGQRVAFRHCDIKPSNLLVKGQSVKVADFSLAVATTSTMGYHRRTGTLDYAAPEVFQGNLSDRTDQYALAVSYIQLRTGKLPFRDTPKVFQGAYQRPAPDLSLLGARERPILARALATVPQDRWPSCTEMMERLAETMIAV